MPDRGPADPNLQDGPHRAINLFPAPCGLLDSQGNVEAVNDEWRAAAASHQLLAPPGQSFIEGITARSGSRRAAEGIRDVLSGRTTTFTIDIASGGVESARWFRLMASGRG